MGATLNDLVNQLAATVAYNSADNAANIDSICCLTEVVALLTMQHSQ